VGAGYSEDFCVSTVHPVRLMSRHQACASWTYQVFPILSPVVECRSRGHNHSPSSSRYASDHALPDCSQLDEIYAVTTGNTASRL